MEKPKTKRIVELFDISKHKNRLVGGNHAGVNPSPGVVMPGAAIRLR